MYSSYEYSSRTDHDDLVQLYFVKATFQRELWLFFGKSLREILTENDLTFCFLVFRSPFSHNISHPIHRKPQNHTKRSKMKLSLSTVATALCISLPAVQAGKTDCLDAKRYNLEIVCRKECAKVDAVAFSVSYDETNDACRCYGNIDGYGTYTGSGDRDSRLTCYSMEQDGEYTQSFNNCL